MMLRRHGITTPFSKSMEIYPSCPAKPTSPFRCRRVFNLDASFTNNIIPTKYCCCQETIIVIIPLYPHDLTIIGID
ncbi:hypothetical protein HMPREF1705_04757 [Acetomicrobium hydrogeniformans ATCC BAA-1850]|uniref:Uncharacterized protein n=1 Tax=Acetomicrobium hydrogeniformans ATCC BAA-1850 TaxID=592015 RepID=A0A0T5X9M6_9BACT|nr:hypothetical protein HMPREF1705_04757 [Acetomicrobium hydrogeniformans ATCC BAA-1850]